MTDGRRKQRTVKPTKVPGIPKPPTDVPASLQRYLSNLGEALEIRLGRKGDVRDRAITLRELIGSGMAVDLLNNPFDPNSPGNDFEQNNDPGGGDVEFPSAPTGFSATAGFSNVGLFWDYPETQYRGHSFTEIFRNTSNNQATAQLIGSSPGSAYTDFHGTVTNTATYYYWARHVNVNNVRGPFHASSGLVATLSVSTDYLLTLLTDSIASSHLVQSLRDPISNLPADTNGSIVAVTADVTSLEAQYTVKIQTNSSSGTYVSGYGLANTTANGATTSAFIVAADRFAVINPATYNVGQTNNNPASTYTPFVVQSTTSNITLPSGEVVAIPPGVFIDSAFISKARILDLIAGSVQADFLLSSSFVRAPNIHGGTFNIGTFSQNGSSDPSNWTISGSNRVSNFSVDANGIMHCESAELKGITVRASDDTVLLDAGGLYTPEGNNNLHNGSFSNGGDGWTTSGSVFFNTTLGRAYTDSNEYIQSTSKIPVSPQETLYVYADVYGASAYCTVIFVKADGTFTSSSVLTSGWSPSAASSQQFRVAKIDYPSYSGNPYVYALARFGTSSGGSTTTWHQCGVSKAPPVIDPAYASTYIRDLSVDTLQIAGNAVTVPLGDSNDPDSAFGSSFIQSEGAMNVPAYNNSAWKNGVSVGPLSWTSTALRPEAVTVTAVVSIEGGGSSSNYVNRWLQVIVGTGSGFSNAKRLAGAIQRLENKEFDDTMLTLVITETLANINLASPLYFKIQAAVSGDASPVGNLRHNGISVLGSKK